MASINNRQLNSWLDKLKTIVAHKPEIAAITSAKPTAERKLCYVIDIVNHHPYVTVYSCYVKKNGDLGKKVILAPFFITLIFQTM